MVFLAHFQRNSEQDTSVIVLDITRQLHFRSCQLDSSSVTITTHNSLRHKHKTLRQIVTSKHVLTAYVSPYTIFC